VNSNLLSQAMIGLPCLHCLEGIVAPRSDLQPPDSGRLLLVTTPFPVDDRVTVPIRGLFQAQDT
jgi:hypothetical protein